jgi:uncharacterized membrane protein
MAINGSKAMNSAKILVFMLLVFICFYDVFNPVLVASVKNGYA